MLSEKARRALVQAIENNDPVSTLEILGLAHRTINTLEYHGILYISQLLQCTKSDLFQLDGMGSFNIGKIIKCLEDYDKIQQ